MKNKNLLLFRIFTAIFSLFIMMGVGMYFGDYDMVKEMYTDLRFPTYLIYPIGIAKTLGVLTLWFVKNDTIKQWAYAGFTFNLLLGFSAHIAVKDNEFFGALLALILLWVSYFFYHRLKAIV